MKTLRYLLVSGVFCSVLLLASGHSVADVRVTPAGDTNQVQREGKWSQSTFRFAQASALETRTDGASLTFQFDGIGVAVRLGAQDVPAYGPASLGQLLITVDEGPPLTVNPQSSAREVLIAGELDPGRHTCKVVHRSRRGLVGCRVESFHTWNDQRGTLLFHVSGDENAHLVDCRAIVRQGKTVVRNTLLRNWLTGNCSVTGLRPGDEYTVQIQAVGWQTARSEEFRIEANRNTEIPPIFLRRDPATVIERFRFPRLNQPVVRRPGETFRARFLGFDAEIQSVQLVRRVGDAVISRQVPFKEDPAAAYYYDREMIVSIPEGMSAGAYDLNVSVLGGVRTGVCRSPRSVHVLAEYPRDPVLMTFGHLDTSGQYQAEYLERLVEVANLAAPDFVLCSNACNPAYVSGALSKLRMPWVVNFGNHQFPGHEKWFGDPVHLVTVGDQLSVLNFGHPWHVDTSRAASLLADSSDQSLRVINAFEPNAPETLLNQFQVRLIHDAHGIGKKVMEMGKTPTVRVGKTNSESFRLVRFRDGRVDSCTYAGHETAPIPFGREAELPISVQFNQPNDGTAVVNRATVTNRLREKVPRVQVVFVMPGGRYRVTGGEITAQVVADGGELRILTVSCDLPAETSVVVNVERVE
jgi:hypothetical protein